MMRIKSKTANQLAMLENHPEVVLRLYYLSGREGVPYKDLAARINEEMGTNPWWVDLGYTNIRRILHRQAPFNKPPLYRKVSEELNELVTRKFRTGVKVQKTATITRVDRPIQKPSTERGNRWNLFLQAAGAARDYKNALERYEAALDAAEAIGMGRDALHRLACEAVDLMEPDNE